ncbi:hypothetical protein NSTCB13_03618 [Nostoc sp. DSM 114160]|jgi:pyruvate dehydrogenase E1 component beta subunit
MAETLFFNALREAIDEEMARDSSVFVLGEDVGHYGGSYKVTKDLYQKYGELRILDTPIAENSFTGMAVGAAMTGLRPIIEGMNMGFLLLAFNQISNNAGMLRYTSGGNFKIPMVIRGPGGVGTAARCRTFPATRNLLPSCARVKDCCLLHTKKRQRTAEIRYPR